LHLVPGLGPRLTAALLAHFGSAAAIRAASPAQLQRVERVGPKLASDFAAALRAADVAGEVASMQKHGVGVWVKGQPPYPEQLAELPDSPPVLYHRGTLLPTDVNAVALVGSRRCTAYGKRMAQRLAAGLARAGVCVVSGLARGIDGVAHRAALEAGGRTVAVLAGGLSRIYPPEHRDLADDVAAAGCLVTETPMRQEPLPTLFPARNRIISGLSRAVVVVEAPEKSGSLITAEHAAEQGREVFAVPGPADSDDSAGCLALLRNGAKLVRSAEDILEDLAGIDPGPPVAARATSPAPPPPPAGPPPELEGVPLRIWEALTGPRHADDLVRALSVSAAELTRVLMVLELKGVVRKLPGNQYERR
jgi:DNA processing protein